MPEQIHNYAHNNDWLVKNLAYVGRVHDAVDLAKKILIELPRDGATRSQAYRMGRERLLRDAGDVRALGTTSLALRPTIYLDPRMTRAVKGNPTTGVRRGSLSKATGLAARRASTRSKASCVKLRAERIAAADQGETDAKAAKKPDDQIAKAMADALRGFASRIDEVEARSRKCDWPGRSRQASGRGPKQLPLAKQLPSIRRAQIHFAIGEFDPPKACAGSG
jgi:hypothetical protein